MIAAISFVIAFVVAYVFRSFMSYPILFIKNLVKGCGAVLILIGVIALLTMSDKETGQGLLIPGLMIFVPIALYDSRKQGR